jgi:uncharacterized surface protein with fasciclin (FAS1) repeats
MKKSSAPRRAVMVLALAAVAVVAVLALSACGGSSTTDKNIPDAASSTSDISTWSDALGTNALTDTLNGAGPFTVFASSDSAADVAGASALSGDVQKAMIIEGSAFTKDELTKGVKNASMLDGNDVLTYTGSDGHFYMNAMKIVSGPIEAKNGVIYVVDGLVTPK